MLFCEPTWSAKWAIRYDVPAIDAADKLKLQRAREIAEKNRVSLNYNVAHESRYLVPDTTYLSPEKVCAYPYENRSIDIMPMFNEPFLSRVPFDVRVYRYLHRFPYPYPQRLSTGPLY